MKSHAAVPDLEDLNGVVEEVCGLVQQHVPQASADHDSDSHPEEQVIGECCGKGRLAVTPEAAVRDQPFHVQPAEQQPGDVGQAVPFDGQRPDLQRHRVDGRVGDNQRNHIRPASVPCDACGR